MKTHVHSASHAMKHDGTVDLEVAARHEAHAKKMYETGKEKLLGIYDVVQHDGSVLTIFHHIAADGKGSTPPV